MKTKLSLSIFLLVLLAISLYWKPQTTPEVLEVTQEAGFYSMKCTVAKYLLSNVDTTQQIAPLFANLGNLHFGISTKDQKAQTYFDQGVSNLKSQEPVSKQFAQRKSFNRSFEP